MIRKLWKIRRKIRAASEKNALDARGVPIFIGDTVALYGYLDMDGYNADPALDNRQWGKLRTTIVIDVSNSSIRENDGVKGWWPSSTVMLVKDNNTE